PPSTCSCGVELDDAVAPERLDVRLTVAEQLAVDLRVVLAEERGAHDVRGGIRQAHGVGRHGVRAPPRMLKVDDEARLAEVLVLEHLGGVEHGAARHAGAGQDLEHLLLGPLRGPRFDLGVELVDDLHAVTAVRIAGILAQLRMPHDAREGLPHLHGRPVDEDVVVRPPGVGAGDVRPRGRRRAGALARGGVARGAGGLPEAWVWGRWIRRRLTTASCCATSSCCPPPVACRWMIAARMPMQVWRPAPVSARPPMALVGGPSGEPVMAMAPAMAWAIHSKLLYSS